MNGEMILTQEVIDTIQMLLKYVGVDHDYIGRTERAKLEDAEQDAHDIIKTFNTFKALEDLYEGQTLGYTNTCGNYEVSAIAFINGLNIHLTNNDIITYDMVNGTIPEGENIFGETIK